MPRNMSFALTTNQITNKTKTVTRRQGWKNLKVGDLLQPVEKAMGLKKGEKVKKIGGLIKVKSIAYQCIKDISQDDVTKEGFPNWSRSDFIRMYCLANTVSNRDHCYRIEFEYI